MNFPNPTKRDLAAIQRELIQIECEYPRLIAEGCPDREWTPDGIDRFLRACEELPDEEGEVPMGDDYLRMANMQILKAYAEKSVELERQRKRANQWKSDAVIGWAFAVLLSIAFLGGEMKKPQQTETPEQKQYRESVEKIAKNISTLARAVEELLDGPLKRKTLIVLLANSSGLGQGSVDCVLSALANIEKDWLNK